MAWTVDFYEMSGFPRTRWVNGEFYGIRKLKLPWSDRGTFLTELDTIANLPWPSGDYPDGPSSAIARQASIRPLPKSRIAGSGSIASYDWAVATVKYSTVGPRINGTDLIDERLDPYTRSHRISAAWLKWSDGTPMQAGELTPKAHHGLQYTITYHRVPTASFPSRVYDLVGYINSNAVSAVLLSKTFAAGTLLYLPPSVRASFGTAGGLQFSISYHYLYAPWGWNKHWRAKSATGNTLGAFESAYVKGTGSPGDAYLQYPATSF